MSGPLRIAIFANTLPPLGPGAADATVRYGGVERAALSLARALAGRGHEVWAFCGTVAGQDRAVLAFDEGRLRIRVARAAAFVGQTPVAPALLRAPREAGRCDVVLAYMGDQPAPTLALHWARRWRAPLVVSFHGDPVGGFGSLARRLGVWAHARWLGPRALRAARAVIALSPAAAGSARLLQPHRAKTTVIPNGVDAAAGFQGTRLEARRRHGVPPGAQAVAFVGSLTPIKGPDVLLEAWARVARPGRVLLVAGDGPERARLEAQAARLGVAGSVRFLGFVPATRSGVLAAADVLALPSRSESFPLTLLEAGLAGVPIVASRIPALEGLVEDGRTALLVPPEDPAALAAALERLLGDEPLARGLADAGLRWALGHRWEDVAARTEELLRSVVEGKASPPA